MRDGRHDVLEHGAGDGEGQRAAVGGAAQGDTPRSCVAIEIGTHAQGDGLTHAVHRKGDPAAEAFAEHDKIRLKRPLSTESAVRELKGVRFIDAQQGAVSSREGTQALMEAWVWQDDVAIRHRRLRQHQRDVTDREHPR